MDGVTSMESNDATAPERTRPGVPTAGRPRHDNDRCNITGIHIMPTYGEITSGAGQYLPAADPASWHLPGASGRFDREFRLLREDNVGQIRCACHDLLQAVNGSGIDAYRRQRTSTHFDFCDDAKILLITPTKERGVVFTVAIKQPASIRNATKDQRRAWWDRCKRFRPGTVVCVLDKAGMILHFAVSDFTLRGPEGMPTKFPLDKYKFNLSSDREWSYVSLELVDSSKLGDALLWYSDTERTRYFLDFPDVKIDSFKHTLDSLQRQCQSPHHLVDLLNPLDRPVVQRPTYARGPGFFFNLDCLMPGGQTFQFDPSDIPVTEIPSNIDLGPDQIKALLESLSAEVALVHGRPGTGKSYLARKIIKVLVHNRENANIGPAICIFHNDSALDRMVDLLLDDGIRGIVRMGDRSGSRRLQSLDLPFTCYEGMRREERCTKQQMSQFLDELAGDIKVRLGRLLSHVHPRSQGFGPWRGDFSENQPSRANAFQFQWATGDPSLLESNRPAFPSLDETLRLGQQNEYQNGRSKLSRDHIMEELRNSCEEFEATRSGLRRFHDDARRQILQDSQVVAVTTTELARYPELLQPIHAKALVCDDAGEFLESQVLTAISPSIEHIILLGDHQVLPEVHIEELQVTNREDILNPLDVSLFERLLDADYDPCLRVRPSTLSLQRRMHPSIARLLRLVQDTGFGNDDLVRAFPEVVGMRQPLFWLDHKHVVGRADLFQDEDFHLDHFDIEMVISMVNHLVRQDHYTQHDIAIITPSLSQFQQLLKRMETEDSFTTRIDNYDLEGLWEVNPKEPQEHGNHSPLACNRTDPGERGAASIGSVRLSTLDSFRGQEAKVVIIPLGRCSSKSALHSMHTSHRIDALVSRPKHGCYILGDSESCKIDPAWRLITNTLEAGGNLGDMLELRCPRHPDQAIRVAGPDDFKVVSPHGGCSQPCGEQLGCGHDCYQSCHLITMHALTKCDEPCPRNRPGCEHACTMTCGECGESCEGRCTEVMHDVNLRLPCGHVLETASCWQVQYPDGVLCEAEVDYKMPGCEHEVVVPCCESDPQLLPFKCPASCGASLQCGHFCQRKCHECNCHYQDTFLKGTHDLCDQPCGKSQPDCAHSCQRLCHGDSECGPCRQPCDVRCSHGKCGKLCCQACEPCSEEVCASACPHSKCTMPCAAPCNWIPCSRRCALLLDCGHQCPSLCGEACPESKYCQSCGADDILFTVVDSFDWKDYKDVNLDEDPCVFPHCGHFQTRSSMDRQLGIQGFYDLADDGAPSTIKGVPKPLSVQKVPCCTQCRGSFRDISRYGRIIRRPMLEGSLKEFMSWSNANLSMLADHVAQHLFDDWNSSIGYRRIPTPSNQQTISIKVDGTMNNQIHVLRDFVGGYRYTDLVNLYRNIQDFSRQLTPKDEIFRKIADLTKRGNENSETAAHTVGTIHLHELLVQPCGDLLAMSLSLRCIIVILADFLKLWKQESMAGTASRSSLPTLRFDLISNFRCSQELIDRASERKRPIFVAQGHVYFAWFCGFACALGVKAITQTRDFLSTLGRRSQTAMTQCSFSDKDLREMGLQNVTKAADIHSNCPLANRHLDELIAATRRFIHTGRFIHTDQLNERVAGDWFMAVGFALRNTGPWYVCGNGHAFRDPRWNPAPLGQLQCTECGLIVAGQGGHASEEGPIVDVVLPSQDDGEKLIDI